MFWKGPYNRKAMPTALVYCGTSEGFVIGADGRAINPRTRQVENDNERKIFAFENRAAAIVFAWAGSGVKLGTPDLSVNLVTETYDSLSRLNFNGLFAQELAADLKHKLRIFTANTTGPCAVGIFLSFLKGSPWVSEITVFRNGRGFDCSVEENFANGEIGIVSGPDAEFEKPASLDDAKKMIEAYLEDCVANPTEVIGGHVHIGKFTTQGFTWIRPPVDSAGNPIA
jgi:hypothetical protein